MSAVKVGDLAVIVKPTPCCGNTTAIGVTFEVAEVGTYVPRCRHCSCQWGGAEAFASLGEGRWVRVSRLKKIEPLGDEREVTTPEEVAA